MQPARSVSTNGNGLFGAFTGDLAVAFDRWIFDPETNELCGLIQIARPVFRPREIPIDRFLLFRPQAHKQNPEGRSALRRR